MKRNARLFQKTRNFTVIAALSSLVLAGCSTSTENEDLETTASAPAAKTKTAASTEYVPASADGPAQNLPEPQMPDVLKEPTQEGARAALEYFWETYQYLRETGDPQYLDSISTADCEYCTMILDKWVEVYLKGNQWIAMNGDLELIIHDHSLFVTDGKSEKLTEGYFYFDLIDPPTDLYIDGENIEESSYIEPETTYWQVDLYFIEEDQYWQVNWIGARTDSQVDE